jgi:hypothetical protein
VGLLITQQKLEVEMAMTIQEIERCAYISSGLSDRALHALAADICRERAEQEERINELRLEFEQDLENQLEHSTRLFNALREALVIALVRMDASPDLVKIAGAAEPCDAYEVLETLYADLEATK